ncbi:MAG: NAD-dependent epimerase/dehydratase family protein [Polyangiaceae bacterium]
MNVGRDVVWVGADGALGSVLAPALGARPLNLRCSDPTDDRPLSELADADTVIDAAGPRVHPGLRWADYLREHVGTTTRVAHSMKAGSHLILISSAAVYGSRRSHVDETTAPHPDTFPVPSYAWAKLAAELAARAICPERGISLTVLRPSIIYGPGAGGVFVTLRNLARRGVRVVLGPSETRHHLLHLDLFQTVLKALLGAQAPRHPATYVVADPFVVTTADVNLALAAAGPRAAPIPVPLTIITSALKQWQIRSDRASGPLSVGAMLELDNVYEWRRCLSHLGIDPGPFGRHRFDNFIGP